MYWAEFLTIAVAHLFAVASPGPDFAVVLKQSVSAGTRTGVWTSLGVAAAILLHVSYCVLGVALILLNSPTLFMVVKYLAALYLLYLGIVSIRDSYRKQAEQGVSTNHQTTESTPLSAFYIGFLTNGLNPKATLFFLSLFTVVIAPTTPFMVQVGYGLYLSLATFLWFALLSFFLGRAKFREAILNLGVWFERIMGLILLILAFQIAIIS
ncbi:MAG: LysE family translocator [Pseudohongiellaceae bacterium]